MSGSLGSSANGGLLVLVDERRGNVALDRAVEYCGRLSQQQQHRTGTVDMALNSASDTYHAELRGDGADGCVLLRVSPTTLAVCPSCYTSTLRHPTSITLPMPPTTLPTSSSYKLSEPFPVPEPLASPCALALAETHPRPVGLLPNAARDAGNSDADAADSDSEPEEPAVVSWDKEQAMHIDDHTIVTGGPTAGAFFQGAQNFTITNGTFVSQAQQQIPCQPAPEFRIVPLGDVDLHNAIVRKFYTASVNGQPMTAVLYEGQDAKKKWIEDVKLMSHIRRPDVQQLYGVVNSHGIFAAIYHGDLIPFDHLITVIYAHDPLMRVKLRMQQCVEYECWCKFCGAAWSRWDMPGPRGPDSSSDNESDSDDESDLDTQSDQIHEPVICQHSGPSSIEDLELAVPGNSSKISEVEVQPGQYSLETTQNYSLWAVIMQPVLLFEILGMIILIVVVSIEFSRYC
ncbi:hypothetical protein HMN09_01177500 [Mycena chlorophos]|uniref:Uncharacterized protein n=1 Tax=Mycena chlorophos TaxID=658473 RepID=A0A8H6S8M7_MYCCL|nr:hypothetical protein HMN09_01177500 [Mycena chlorophos]